MKPPVDRFRAYAMWIGSGRIAMWIGSGRIAMWFGSGRIAMWFGSGRMQCGSVQGVCNVVRFRAYAIRPYTTA